MIIIILKLLLAALLITALNFALGALWYSRFLFGGIFMSSMTPEEQEKAKNTPMLPVLAIEFALGFMMSLAAMAIFVLPNFKSGFITGLMLSIFVLLPMFISDKLWCKGKSWKAWGISSGHKAVSITLIFALAGLANNVILQMN